MMTADVPRTPNSMQTLKYFNIAKAAHFGTVNLLTSCHHDLHGQACMRTVTVCGSLKA